MNILITVGLALIMGCGVARQTNEGLAPYRRITTILVANEGLDMIRVYDGMERIATVMSGRAKCVQLKSPERTFQLSFSILAGGGNRYFAPIQSFGSSSGWIWTIDGSLPTISTIRINVHDVCNPGGEGSIREIR